MELRQYFAVVRRRWPLVAVIVVLTALVSAGMLFTQRPVYTAAARLAMRQVDLPAQLPTPNEPGFYSFDNYYNWYSTEFLADDYTQIVPSQAFAERVVVELKKQNLDYSAGAVLGALSATRVHRELTIAASTGDPASAVAIVQAGVAVLTAISAPDGTTPNLNGVTIHDQALFAAIDVPTGAGSNRSRQVTNAIIALGVGVVLALALAFLAEYLDTTLRDSADAAQVTGLPVVGAIPVRR